MFFIFKKVFLNNIGHLEEEKMLKKIEEFWLFFAKKQHFLAMELKLFYICAQLWVQSLLIFFRFAT